MNMKKITMGLGQRDEDNVEFLKKHLNSRSKAAAVAQSLDIAKLIVEARIGGDTILLKDEKGKQRELIISGI